jgi:UDP-GlcNAc3NAcA epimerase
MKILTVLGARPQFIKAAPVSLAFARAGVEEVMVHTGQHYDANMSDVFFAELAIPAPRHNLGIGGGSHAQMTGAQLVGVEEIIGLEKPDGVLVYGDTNSTLAGSLAAAKLKVPVAHVEAGLRSFNRDMPEEINRVVTDHVSTLLFAPTDAAMRQLEREGIPASRCYQVGDVMFDAAKLFGAAAGRRSTIVARQGLPAGGYVLSTIHRAENTDDPARLATIMAALDLVGRELPVVLPIHPRTRRVLQEAGLMNRLGAGIRLLDPLGYLDMMALVQGAGVVATDSGGLQKEAFFFGIPCSILRKETEWTELVDAGWNTLAPLDDPQALAWAVLGMRGRRGQPIQPYGDGMAAGRIATTLSAGFPR